MVFGFVVFGMYFLTVESSFMCRYDFFFYFAEPMGRKNDDWMTGGDEYDDDNEHDGNGNLLCFC